MRKDWVFWEPGTVVVYERIPPSKIEMLLEPRETSPWSLVPWSEIEMSPERQWVYV
jgi:hypothetical protein